jgi:hypothetical protein
MQKAQAAVGRRLGGQPYEEHLPLLSMSSAGNHLDLYAAATHQSDFAAAIELCGRMRCEASLPRFFCTLLDRSQAMAYHRAFTFVIAAEPERPGLVPHS